MYEPTANPFDPKIESKLIIEKELNADPTWVGFGEIALLLNSKRTASIIANSDCQTWSLSADVFKHIIASNTMKRRNINLSYLDNVSLFKNLETYEKLKLIDGLQVRTFTKEQFVFHEGQTGEEFFIIESGECECIKVDADEESGYRLIRILGESDHFGEVAILKNIKRTLSVRAATNLKLLVLTREAFNRILGSIKDFLKEDY